jgi:hypothetical protein
MRTVGLLALILALIGCIALVATNAAIGHPVGVVTSLIITVAVAWILVAAVMESRDTDL